MGLCISFPVAFVPRELEKPRSIVSSSGSSARADASANVSRTSPDMRVSPPEAPPVTAVGMNSCLFIPSDAVVIAEPEPATSLFIPAAPSDSQSHPSSTSARSPRSPLSPRQLHKLELEQVREHQYLYDRHAYAVDDETGKDIGKVLMGPSTHKPIPLRVRPAVHVARHSPPSAIRTKAENSSWLSWESAQTAALGCSAGDEREGPWKHRLRNDAPSISEVRRKEAVQDYLHPASLSPQSPTKSWVESSGHPSLLPPFPSSSSTVTFSRGTRTVGRASTTTTVSPPVVKPRFNLNFAVKADGRGRGMGSAPSSPADTMAGRHHLASPLRGKSIGMSPTAAAAAYALFLRGEGDGTGLPTKLREELLSLQSVAEAISSRDKMEGGVPPPPPPPPLPAPPFFPPSTSPSHEGASPSSSPHSLSYSSRPYALALKEVGLIPDLSGGGGATNETEASSGNTLSHAPPAGDSSASSSSSVADVAQQGVTASGTNDVHPLVLWVIGGEHTDDTQTAPPEDVLPTHSTPPSALADKGGPSVL